MISRVKAGIIAAVLFACPLTMNHLNYYMSERPYDVKVVDVISGLSSGKYSSLEFIAVYELPDGYRFDRHISASDSTWMKPGQDIKIRLRPFDVKQSSKENIIWFFGSLFVNVCGFAFGSLASAMAISRRFNKYMSE